MPSSLLPELASVSDVVRMWPKAIVGRTPVAENEGNALGGWGTRRLQFKLGEGGLM